MAGYPAGDRTCSNSRLLHTTLPSVPAIPPAYGAMAQQAKDHERQQQQRQCHCGLRDCSGPSGQPQGRAGQWWVQARRLALFVNKMLLGPPQLLSHVSPLPLLWFRFSPLSTLLRSAIFFPQFHETTFQKHRPIRPAFLKLFQRHCALCRLLLQRCVSREKLLWVSQAPQRRPTALGVLAHATILHLLLLVDVLNNHFLHLKGRRFIHLKEVWLSFPHTSIRYVKCENSPAKVVPHPRPSAVNLAGPTRLVPTSAPSTAPHQLLQCLFSLGFQVDVSFCCSQ